MRTAEASSVIGPRAGAAVFDRSKMEAEFPALIRQGKRIMGFLPSAARNISVPMLEVSLLIMSAFISISVKAETGFPTATGLGHRGHVVSSIRPFDPFIIMRNRRPILTQVCHTLPVAAAGGGVTSRWAERSQKDYLFQYIVTVIYNVEPWLQWPDALRWRASAYLFQFKIAWGFFS